MSEELTKDSQVAEATITDTAASQSCTRSGAFALLLSLVLGSLIPYWLQERKENVLSRYFALRLSLATYIDQLDDDPQWQQYKASNEAAESMSIEQLKKIRMEIPTIKANTKQVEPISDKINENKTRADSTDKLPALTNISLSLEIDLIHQIVNFLTALNDSELLTTSRNASSLYNYAIFRWALKRDKLIERNLFINNPSIITVYMNDEERPEHFVPAHDKDRLLKYLTLHNVRELAHFELPKISDTTKLGIRYGKEIDVSSGSLPLPRNLYMASIGAGVLLLFVIMYFKAFTREAISSAMFPAPGTLFSAFSKSYSTLAVFIIALWTPVAASLVLARVSREWPLYVCSVLIGCAVLSVYIDLKRKLYFKELCEFLRHCYAKWTTEGVAS